MLNNGHLHDERRDSIRAKRIITVRHRLVLHNDKSQSPDALWQLSTTENMSLSGALFSSANVYTVGDVIELQVVMSGVLEIFNGYAKVMRVVRQKGGHAQVGVKYVDLKVKKRPAKSLHRLNE